MKGTMTRLALLAIAIAALAGCGQPVSLHVEAESQGQQYVYDVQPDGKLKITKGALETDGKESALYSAQLDKEQAKRLSKVVQQSGFLVDYRGRVGEAGDTRLTVTAKIGLIENNLIVESAYVDSVGKIIQEMNADLPKKYQLPYDKKFFPAQGLGESLQPSSSDDWLEGVGKDMREFGH